MAVNLTEVDYTKIVNKAKLIKIVEFAHETLKKHNISEGLLAYIQAQLIMINDPDLKNDIDSIIIAIRKFREMIDTVKSTTNAAISPAKNTINNGMHDILNNSGMIYMKAIENVDYDMSNNAIRLAFDKGTLLAEKCIIAEMKVIIDSNTGTFKTIDMNNTKELKENEEIIVLCKCIDGRYFKKTDPINEEYIDYTLITEEMIINMFLHNNTSTDNTSTNAFFDNVSKEFNKPLDKQWIELAKKSYESQELNDTYKNLSSSIEGYKTYTSNAKNKFDANNNTSLCQIWVSMAQNASTIAMILSRALLINMAVGIKLVESANSNKLELLKTLNQNNESAKTALENATQAATNFNNAENELNRLYSNAGKGATIYKNSVKNANDTVAALESQYDNINIKILNINQQQNKQNQQQVGQVSNQPVANQSVVNQPVANQPVANQPVANQSVVNQPVVNQPAQNQPVANQSVVNQPVVNQPVVNQPAQNQPVANQSVVNQPVANQPVANQPVQPAAQVQDQPVVEPAAPNQSGVKGGARSNAPKKNTVSFSQFVKNGGRKTRVKKSKSKQPV